MLLVFRPESYFTMRERSSILKREVLSWKIFDFALFMDETLVFYLVSLRSTSAARESLGERIYGSLKVFVGEVVRN